MSQSREERLAVLRLVAAGRVTPEDGLELLEALGPEPEAAVAAQEHDGRVLRVRFQDPPKHMDFTVRVPATKPLAAALRDILTMLPGDAERLVPPGLLRGLGSVTVGEAPDDTLVRIQDAPLELTVRRIDAEAVHAGPAAGFRFDVRRGRYVHGRHYGFGW